MQKLFVRQFLDAESDIPPIFVGVVIFFFPVVCLSGRGVGCPRWLDLRLLGWRGVFGPRRLDLRLFVCRRASAEAGDGYD